MENKASELRILLVEDEPQDVKRFQLLLEQSPHRNMHFISVETLAAARRAVNSESFDAILLDLGLPDSEGVQGVALMNQYASEIPIIVLSANTDDAVSFDSIKHGAQDYLLKETVDGRLIFRVIQFAIERKRFSREREKLIDELRSALAKINKMKGLIPICAYCKKIRNDSGFWNQFEEYMHAHSEVEFSHGICPTCQAAEMRKFKSNLGKKSGDASGRNHEK